MSDIRLPDIAEFQDQVDHPALVAGLRQAYGAAIVIARVCYGNSAVDQQADRNIDGLRAAGADALGWYCYLIAGQDPVAQADTFCRVLQAHGGLRRNEFVVCDDEEGTGDQSSRVDTFLARVDAVLQAIAAQDMWYSGLLFSLAHDLSAAVGHRWIAAYQGTEPTDIAHDLWQNTDAQQFPGIAQPCDASVFHGTLSDFLSLIGGLNVAQLDDIQTTLNGLSDGLLKQTYNGTDPGGNPIAMPWQVSYGLSTLYKLAAQVATLVGDDSAAQGAITALGNQVQALLQGQQAAATSAAVLAAKLDAVLTGLPADEAAGIRAELDALSKHLGVGVA